MGRGRHPSGPSLVDGLEGPDEAKRRLKVILEPIASGRPIAEACAELGIGEAAFHNLRKQALEGAISSLAPRPAGRPRKDADPEQQRIHQLEEQVFQLKMEAQAARVQAEIALTMPHLLKKRKANRPEAGNSKKKDGATGNDKGNPASTGPAAPTEPTSADAHAGSHDATPQSQAGPPAPVAGQEAVGVATANEVARDEPVPRRKASRQEKRHMRRVKAAMEVREAPKESKRRYGPGWQVDPRTAERAVRVAAIAFRRWAQQHNVARAHAAKFLGISERTLAAWEADWERNHLLPSPRGRSAERSKVERRNLLVVVLRTMDAKIGLPLLRAIFRTMPRRELEDITRRYKRLRARSRRLAMNSLRWMMPGSVWAIDFTAPPAPVAGVFPTILSVRDLGSGMQLAWLPLEDESAKGVELALRTLIAQYGPPLLIKKDNGSALNDGDLNAMLDEFGITGLLSPVMQPSYNGSCEAGIGAMKVRTQHHAEKNARFGYWTSDDCEAARLQADFTARLRGANGPTPEELWSERHPISDELRRRLQRLIVRFDSEVRRQRGYLPGVKLESYVEAWITREAIGRALVACGILQIRRGRISLPIFS